jgi:hypothetical protein
MKSAMIKHAAVAGLAFAAIFLTSRAKSSAVAAEPSHLATRKSQDLSRASASGAKARTMKLSATEYQSAWDSLAARRLPANERYHIQIELLRRWAEVDLQAALHAALAEAWDDQISWNDGINGLLKEGFSQVFLDRSDDVWKMIRDEKFGILGGALVRDAWVAALGAKNPELMLSYLPEMDGLVFRNALTTLSNQIESPVQAKHLWDELTKKKNWPPDARELLEQVGINFAHYSSAQELAERTHIATGPLAAVACNALAAKLCLWDAKTLDLQAEVQKVPEELRGQFAYQILKLSGDKAAVSDALNQLVESEQWDLLGKPEAGGKVKWLANMIEPAELAEWSANLPERKETSELFHRGIETYIQKDPTSAWAWIGEFEDGMWRDHAYAEYSQQCLRRFKDPAKSREALDQIQDPEFKKTAESWRSSWAKETGWKGG